LFGSRDQCSLGSSCRPSSYGASSSQISAIPPCRSLQLPSQRSSSLGGNLVLHAAREGTVDAVVAYYAARSEADAARTRCPVQLHLAENDDLEDPDDLAAYVAALEAAGTPVDVFTYPGTGHSFANLDVPLGDAAAADVARSRTLGFLRARLAG